MTFSAITLKMMRENYKQYLLYLGCNAFAVMFLFLFFSIYYNKTIDQMKESHSFDTVLSIPAVALILFMFFFVQYAHQMFVKKRNSEFGILLAIGMTPNNIIRLVITENILIAGISLLLGLLFGGVFSKLFFYVFTYFSQLKPELYHLSFKMFSYTATIFLVMFCITVTITAINIRTQSSITVIQSKQVIDKAKTTHALFGVIGFASIIISILGLFLTYRTHDQLLFLWAMLTFLGLYLLLANIVHTLIYLVKGNPTLYFRFILLFSSLEQKQKKLTSLLTLTSIMIMITTLYCTITLIIAKDEYNHLITMNPSDIAFISEQENLADNRVTSIFNENNSAIEHVQIFPFIEIIQETYYGEQIYTNILSVKDYLELTSQSGTLTDDECIIFINQSSEYGYEQYEKYEIGTKEYEVVANEMQQLLTHISNSVVYVVVADNVWRQLKQTAELKYQYHFFLEDWQNSLPVVQQLRSSQTQLQFTVDSITSKVERYQQMNEENAVLFYIMSFLSILFYFGTFILLYLNLLADIDIEKTKFQKLFKIGITKKELRQQFNYETALLFFTPTLLGLVLALFYILGMAQKSGEYAKNIDILFYFFVMGGIYFMIQFGFYFYVKTKIFRKVWASIS